MDQKNIEEIAKKTFAQNEEWDTIIEALIEAWELGYYIGYEDGFKDGWEKLDF